MSIDDVRAILNQEPFVPLEIRKADGGKLDIPFRHVTIILKGQGLLLFEGVESPTSHVAKRYHVVPFDQVQSIKPRPQTKGRRKAS